VDDQGCLSVETTGKGKYANACNRLKTWAHAGRRKQQGITRKHKSQADKSIAVQSATQVTTKTLMSVLGIIGAIDTVVLTVLVARRLVLWQRDITDSVSPG
jgi:hypothetical protein